MTEPSALQQIADYIDRSRKILIALPAVLTLDRTCAAVALYLIMQKLGKEPTMVSSGADHLPVLDFLPMPPQIQPGLSSSNSLVVRLNTSHAELEELSYETTDHEVKIFLKPKQGQFSPADVTTGNSEEPFDLIIVLGARALEDLGEVYQADPDLFFNTPKINIDIDGGNEYFGTVNLIDVTASALTEVAAQLIASLEEAVTDEHVATSLLAGIISSTHSFQDPATTPKTLTLASHLITQGARQQEIIKSLYKTKDFSLLKLWGRALARIKTLPEISLLYSVLTKSDFEKTGQSPAQLTQVMRELLENVSGFQILALMAEQGSGIKLMIAGLPHTNFQDIAKKFGSAGHVLAPMHGLYQAVSLDLPDTSTVEVEQQLLAAAQDQAV